MRRRVLTGGSAKVPGIIDVQDTQACDVVFYNPDIDDLIIRRDEKDWQENETPVGIVVIPASHGVLKDGSGTVNHCGVISIVNMSTLTPENGIEDAYTIEYGGYGTNITGKADGLQRYDSVTNGLQDYRGLISIPIQSSKNEVPSVDNPTGTVENPYKDTNTALSKERNEEYGSDASKCTSDFKGIVNTKILTDLAKSSWKTSKDLVYPNNVVTSAACCCGRFKTIGTKSFAECSTEELKKGTQFWYMPAAGELCYIIPRLYDIEDTISKLKTTYGIGCPILSSVIQIWSSTEYGATEAHRWNYNIKYIDGLNKYNSMIVRAFMQLAPPIEYEFVDMGLSVDWCTCNIGARSPEEYGWYFMWGGIIPYNSNRIPVKGGDAVKLDYTTCPYWKSGNGTSSKWSKYTAQASSYSSTGKYDNKFILEPEDDAACIHLGGDWRMPTADEFQELIDACNMDLVVNYNGTGIKGVLFTLKTDSSKTLFFPASGQLDLTSWNDVGSYGYYWSSSIDDTAPYFGKVLGFELREQVYGVVIYSNYRYRGLPIRPVRPKQ